MIRPAPAGFVFVLRLNMSRYIITGNLGSRQNVVSISAWLREYARHLFRIDPEAVLVIAGKNPDEAIISAASAFGARVVPSPKDMSELLLDADIYICPSDNGSGIKLRVMDGLKYGLPVVAHTLASRGYEAFIGTSLFLYDDEPSFEEALHAARGMSGKREVLKKQYEQVFSFQSGVNRLRKILEL